MNSEFDALVSEQAESLLRTAYLLTGSQQDAEDLVQETFLDVHRHWRSVSASRSRPAYVRRMLTNRFLTERRRKRFPLGRTDPRDQAAVGTSLEDMVADRDAFARAIRALPPRERTAVVLKHYVRLTNREVGEAMGIEESSARSALARGIGTLREFLANPPSDTTPVGRRQWKT